MSDSYVRDSAYAGTTAHNDGGRWLSVANPAVVDTGKGIYAFTANKTNTVVKVYEVPLSGRTQMLTFGVKHAASSADFKYTLRVVESDDLPTGGVTYNDYMAAACLPGSAPSVVVARDTSAAGSQPAIVSGKRRYLFFIIQSTSTKPNSNVTFSVLSYDSHVYDTMRY